MVTAARLTSLPNWALALGETVDKAMAVCNTPHTNMPMIGAFLLLSLENKEGNMP
ncbi:hypothetical protein D3C75_1324550 [compost metagenome]